MKPKYAHAELAYVQRDREGRRCDGNSRRCTTRAVEQHLVRRTNPGDGFVGEPELKQTCSRHSIQFTDSELWIHVSTSRMGGREWPAAS